MREYNATYFCNDNTLSLHGIEAPKSEVVSIRGNPLVLTTKTKSHSYTYGFSSTHTRGNASTVYDVYQITSVIKHCENSATLKLTHLTTIPIRWNGDSQIAPSFRDLLS